MNISLTKIYLGTADSHPKPGQSVLVRPVRKHHHFDYSDSLINNPSQANDIAVITVSRYKKTTKTSMVFPVSSEGYVQRESQSNLLA